MALVLVSLSCLTARAVTIERLPGDQTKLLLIKGEFLFTDDAQTLVKEALVFQPSLIIFDSGGGNVDAAMRFGRAIRMLGLTTVQIRKSECASACALAFLGGKRRIAEAGSIGVHRASFSTAPEGGTEMAVSAVQSLTANIIQYMTEMGIDPSLLALSLSTDSADMRYLTTEEMRLYRVVTSDGETIASNNPEPQPSPKVADTTTPYQGPVTTIEAVATRPNRMAVYQGLDFIGRDIANAAVPNAGSCAARCVETPLCKAFTFNTSTKNSKYPNCFLKSSQGQLDGNSVAISGSLLSGNDPDSSPLMFGIIDPQTSIFQDISVPGFNISQSADPNADTAAECRIACINDGRCAAFTFLPKRNQCWLKSGIGETDVVKGAVTGSKSAMSFVPDIIALEK